MTLDPRPHSMRKHARAKVNDEHKEVDDYVFDANMPNFCLMCHPDGNK